MPGSRRRAAGDGLDDAPQPILSLVGKPGCQLCDEMRSLAEPLLRARGLALVELDVREHPELERLYLLEIPVLMYEGREVARHRVTPAELLERLAALGIA